MTNKNIELFMKELDELQEKYKIYISADYNEDCDYDYEGNMHPSGFGESYLVFLDENGYEIKGSKMGEL